MSLFSSILHTIQKKITEQESERSLIVECIKSTTGVSISETVIHITKGVLTIQVSPTIKTVLFLKQKAILDECKKRGVPIYTIR